jgi:hypothetical protein
MISIVVCCRKDSDCSNLETSIRATIGLPYELIVVNDSSYGNSIFRALNSGVEQASYEHICFTHDDVQFHTNNWGNIVLNHLKKEGTGLIGIAGAPTLGNIPSDWSFDVQFKFLRQKKKQKKEPNVEISGVFNEENSLQVVTLDGVFLCCHKSLFQTLRFDENRFSGFHSYDMDLCLQAHFSGYENRVINDVLIEHASMGNKNKSWIENQLILWRKWSKLLPTSVLPINAHQLLKKEKHYMEYHFAKRMAKCGYSFDEIKQILKEYENLRGNQARFRTIHLLLAKVFDSH